MGDRKTPKAETDLLLLSFAFIIPSISLTSIDPMIDRNSNVVHLCRDEERFLTFIRSSSDENRKGRSWEEEEHEEEEEEEEKKEEEEEKEV